ncbi:MAG: Glu-tRNA(Gln) amidotransferase subunit GatE [Candidatus Woesearchaeota archaeon]
MELDYKKLGLKVGLEIHQQLDTHKLFCSCPSELREDKPDIIVRRKIRAAAGESGKVDIAAEMEKDKDITFVYEAYSDTNCLVELDEEPPHDMNKEALNIALQVAKMLNAHVVDEIQVMRKTIANGSVTSGFQRTSLVATGGHMKFDFGSVGVPTIMVEEDAAKEVSSTPDVVTWRLDRLGIPLIELATTPDIHTPEQAKEVAAYIGMVLRSTGKVKHGLGTIRQDLNVNIEGAQRVELKGAQDLKMLPKIVELEVVRQKNLLDVAKKVHKDIKIGAVVDVTSFFKSSESKVVKSALDNSGVVLAVKLPKLHGLLGLEIQPGRRVGTELSDWAKARAGVGGIFHSDELPKYGITALDVENLRNKLECSKEDAFVMIADTADKSQKALHGVIDRAKMLERGIVKEVRKVNADGTSSFMRLMPGAARMYPETDVLSVRPVLSGIETAELISDKSLRFEKKYGLGKDLAELAAKSELSDTYEDYCRKFVNVKPAFIAEILLGSVKTVRSMFGVDISPSVEDFHLLFESLDSGLIAKDSVLEILKLNKPVKSVIDDFKMMSDVELRKELEAIVAHNKALPFNALIGKAMGKLKGKADGKKIVDFLKEMCH